MALICSADLAGSTNIAGFSKGWKGSEDFGMYHRERNPKGTLLPQGITEFANAGLMCGISSVNFSPNPYSKFSGFILFVFNKVSNLELLNFTDFIIL